MARIVRCFPPRPERCIRPLRSGGKRAMPITEITRLDRETNRWDEAFMAFLAEKERRSGSLRTVQSYSRMLAHFSHTVEKPPDCVISTEVFGWAHGVGLS